RLLAWELAGQLREAAWQVALAEAGMAAQEAATHEARQALDRLTRLVTLGERPRADLVTLEGMLLELDIQLEVARAECHQALAVWRQLSRQSSPPEVKGELLATERPVEDHPQWAQARQGLERAKGERELGVLAAQGTPALGLVARQEQAPGSPTRDALALNLSLPLPWERHRQAAEASLRYAETEASVRLARLTRALEIQRQQARLGLEAARTQASLLERRAQSAREELRLAGRRLEAGELDTLDYVNVMRKTFEAERAARLAELEVGRWIARFNQAQGVLP
ncbi:MAG: TolC family protein, partial [Gammaproteobacteria bacterium]|nr:TolC family protein [Gammaproteobacteria bacterium]